MERSSGSPEVKIGFIDGSVVTQHPDLASEHLQEIPGNNGATCTQANSAACLQWLLLLSLKSRYRKLRPSDAATQRVSRSILALC